MKRPIAATFVMLSVAACAATEPKPRSDVQPARPAVEAASPIQTRSETSNAPALAIDAEGLRLFDASTGSARPLTFGLPQDQVLGALKGRGTPVSGRLGECGAGPLDQASWPDGLTLYFRDGKFAGWAVGPDKGAVRLTTAAGIGPGSTREALEDAYAVEVFQSTLGTEFSAGELFGLLDGDRKDSRVTHMWAGTSCNMR